LYLLNPKVAKNIAPATSALVKEMMNKSTDKFQLYTYPFATMVAVVLAMMLNGRTEEEEEEQRQQMPAGALSPQAGALSQQQVA
jgi:CBS domain containing-hemolysin-like protein